MLDKNAQEVFTSICNLPHTQRRQVLSLFCKCGDILVATSVQERCKACQTDYNCTKNVNKSADLARKHTKAGEPGLAELK